MPSASAVRSVNRRALLAATASASTAALAGCNVLDDGCPPPAVAGDAAASDRGDGDAGDSDAGAAADRPRDAWPSDGYDHRNSGYAPAGPDESTEVWRYDRDAATDVDLVGYWSAPVVADGSVYAATMRSPRFAYEDASGYVLALDAATGEREWLAELPRLASTAPELVADGLLVGDAGGRLHSVSLDGNRGRTRRLDAVPVGVTAAGDRAYVLDDAGTLHALAVDGDRCFAQTMDELADNLLGSPDRDATGPPAVDADHAYVAVREDRGNEAVAVVRAVEHGGDVAWTHEFPVRYATPNAPAVAGDRVLVTGGSQFRVLDAATGDVDLAYSLGYEYAGPPATDGDLAYVPAKNLCAVDLGTGTERWRVVNHSVADPSGVGFEDGIPFVARPAVTDDAVYHRAGAYDATTGDRLWGSRADDEILDARFRTDQFSRVPFARPAVTADALYLGHQHRGVCKYA